MSMANQKLNATPQSAAPPHDWAQWCWRQARKIVVLVFGVTVLLIGVALLVLPGPGWVIIFIGLAILATEFAWARWMLKHAKAQAGKLMDAAKEQMGIKTDKEGEKKEPGDAVTGL
jgi:tellurite resistance protein TerC